MVSTREELHAEEMGDPEETYGVALNGFERGVFERALRGTPVARIAAELQCRQGFVRKMLAEGTNVNRALKIARRQNYLAAQEKRNELLAMTLDEAQDQLSRPDSEISPSEKRELMYEVWDRMGLPKVTHSKGEIRHTGAIAAVPIDIPALLSQLHQLGEARALAIEAVGVASDDE